MSLKFDDNNSDASRYNFDPIETSSEQILDYIYNIFRNYPDNEKKTIIIFGEKGMTERLSTLLTDKIESPNIIGGIEMEYSNCRGMYKGHLFCLIGTSKLNNSPGEIYVFFQ